METVPGGSIEGRPHPNGPMDTGCQWEAHPTSHSYWMKLHQCSWAITVRVLGRDWHWGQSLQEKKLAMGSQVKLLACCPVQPRGALQHPTLCFAAEPCLRWLCQHPCFDSIFAQFCSFAATCAFKVLCSTNLCFAALNALKHFCTF